MSRASFLALVTNLIQIKMIFELDLFFLYLDLGNEWCARGPKKNVIFCFDKHSTLDIMLSPRFYLYRVIVATDTDRDGIKSTSK